MKLSLFSIIYLFIRTIPMIVLFYFIYQYFNTFDINILYFLIGLVLTFFIVILIGNTGPIQNYKNLDITKKIPLYCNTLLLGKNGPFSALPLSQSMFGYMLFFIFYILFKYGLIQQNIQYLVMFSLFIFIDMSWNLANECINPSLVLLALVFGSSMGLLYAYIVDKSSKTDLKQFQRFNRSKDKCKFNEATNTYTCYGEPDKYENIDKTINTNNKKIMA